MRGGWGKLVLVVTFQPTRSRPVGLRTHVLAAPFATVGLVLPAALVGAISAITWGYDSDKRPVLTSASVRYWHPRLRSSVFVEMEDGVHSYISNGVGLVASLDPAGVVLRSLCGMPQTLASSARYKHWWDWADQGRELDDLPGRKVRVRVGGAELPASYDHLSRSQWMLAFTTPIDGTWVALHGTMKMSPSELAIGPIDLPNLPAEFPLPPWAAAKNSAR